MGKGKISAILYFVASACFYGVAVLNFIGMKAVIDGVFWLCLGTIWLCIGFIKMKELR